MNIVSLLSNVSKLAPGIRIIVTSRQDSRVEQAFLDADELFLSAPEYIEHNRNDIHRFVQVRLRDDKKLANRAAQIEPLYIAQLLEIVPHKAEGNFLYARFLLDAMAIGVRSLIELGGLPERLDGLYFESLQRVVRIGKGDWYHEYAPLIAMLSVSQESPTLDLLQSFTEQSKTSVLKCLHDLRQFIEEVKLKNKKGEGETRYRLYHQSFIDFIHRSSLFIGKKELPNSFYLPKNEWHKAMAKWCEGGKLEISWEDMVHKPTICATR